VPELATSQTLGAWVDHLQDSLRTTIAPLDAVAALVPARRSVLELGCGQGLVMERLAPAATRVVGIDFDARKCRMARNRLRHTTNTEIIEGDLIAYLESLAPGAFEVFVLSDTLSSFDRATQEKILRLVGQKLGPGGTFVLSCVDGAAGWKTRLSRGLSTVIYKGFKLSLSASQNFHYGTVDEYRRVLESEGCDTQLHRVHEWPPRPIPHVALVARKRSPSAAEENVDVRFAVLNLRLGGQVSSLVALRDQLAARGVTADFLLPEGVSSIDKASLDTFTQLPGHVRLQRVWRALSLARPASPRSILHLVLPSPSFAPLAALLPWPSDRIVIQYESFSTRIDLAHLAALVDDPGLVLPRLILNNALWSTLARSLAVSHLASHPFIERQLLRDGFERVTLIPNLGSVTGSDDAGLPSFEPLQRSGGEVWVGYIGHAHPVKGVDDLVSAFEQVAPQRPELRLLLALSRDGDGERLRERVLRSSIRDRVRLEGLVPVNATLAALDAAALPYRSALSTTMYPSVLLEAHEARCPMIVSRLPELDSILEYGSQSLTVVTPIDVESLADALRRVTPRAAAGWAPYLSLPDEGARLQALLGLYARVVESPHRTMTDAKAG
jgi:glycosyltransferase involved in cell wall biosynthesis